MDGVILVINAGSSSVKFSVFTAAGERLAAGPHGQVEGIGATPKLTVSGLPDGGHVDAPQDAAAVADHAGALRVIHDWLTEHHAGEASVAAIGHRVVHGGLKFTGPVKIGPQVLDELQALVPLAPLHQPAAIAAIRAAAEAAPHVPQFACFDTSFHHDRPRLARLFALPRDLSDAGVLRYGFHGLSYEYIAAALPDVAPAIADKRVVVAHLGAGASLCAIHHGRSVATTMSFTALDGLMMGTRCGALDPGVVLYLQTQRGMAPAQVEDLLYHRAGLLGVSGGLSADMRTLLDSPAPAAAEAVALFVYRILHDLGAMAAALGGLDALVFTAGIGEHAAPVRAAILQQAGWLGLALDPAANDAGGPLISPPGAAASAWVVPTDENLMIAGHVRTLCDGG